MYYTDVSSLHSVFLVSDTRQPPSLRGAKEDEEEMVIQNSQSST